MVRVKICGLTNVPDALLAQELGADIAGFIFSDSPRRVTPAAAKKIIKSLKRSVLKAGVFVNERPEKVNRLVKALGLNIVQLHGDETPSYIRKIKGARVVKAIRVRDIKTVKTQAKKYENCVDALLFDAYSREARGGTGKQFNWKILKAIRKIKKPFFIAGGINPLNARRAIKESKPFGIDVSSGVERSKGKKDAGKMRRLFREVKKSS